MRDCIQNSIIGGVIIFLFLLGDAPRTYTEAVLLNNAYAEALPKTAKSFVVFDATLYKNKPDLSVYGIRPLNILYVSQFYKNNDSMEQLPSRFRVKELANKAAIRGDFVLIDIEHWPVKGMGADVSETVYKFSELIKWFREDQPSLRLGVYALPPIQDYWRAIGGPTGKGYQAWQAENNKLMSIAQSADAVFPSLYTFYPDRQGWEKYAVEQIREARRFGKPVYVFLWPQYHESNRLLGGMFLAQDYWKLQLETAFKYADGIVIWGGWGETGPTKWNEAAPWWLVTKEFVVRLGSL